LPDLRPISCGRMGILDFVELVWSQPQSSATFPNIFTLFDWVPAMVSAWRRSV
jgi:hypothetical protein